MPSFLDILKYLFLGMVQGIAEILPISSSGHLALFQALLNVNAGEEATFAIFVHLTSLIALIIFFRKLIGRILVGTWRFLFKKDHARKPDFMLLVYVIVATIPAALIGYLLDAFISAQFGNLLAIGLFFLITAVTLFLISRIKRPGSAAYTWRNVLGAGLFQVFGILPGISRSGITISGGRLAGLNDEKAKEFAFLLFIPVAAGSFLLSLGDLSVLLASDTATLILYGLSALASGLFTFLALIVIFRYIRTKHYPWFSLYLVIVGIFTIVYSFLK